MEYALIWDAGGGIGQAITRQLADENWQILAAGRHLESFTGLTKYVYYVELSDSFSIRTIASIGQEVSKVNLWAYAAGDIASQ